MSDKPILGVPTTNWRQSFGNGSPDQPVFPRYIGITVHGETELAVGESFIFKPRDHPDDKREFPLIIESIEPRDSGFFITGRVLEQ